MTTFLTTVGLRPHCQNGLFPRGPNIREMRLRESTLTYHPFRTVAGETANTLDSTTSPTATAYDGSWPRPAEPTERQRCTQRQHAAGKVLQAEAALPLANPHKLTNAA
jgi:hypothetical protein